MIWLFLVEAYRVKQSPQSTRANHVHKLQAKTSTHAVSVSFGRALCEGMLLPLNDRTYIIISPEKQDEPKKQWASEMPGRSKPILYYVERGSIGMGCWKGELVTSPSMLPKSWFLSCLRSWGIIIGAMHRGCRPISADYTHRPKQKRLECVCGVLCLRFNVHDQHSASGSRA